MPWAFIRHLRLKRRGFPAHLPVLLLVVGAIVSPETARAACTNPAGMAAEIVYNSSEHVPQYCDGSQWVAIGPIAAGPGDDCATPSAPAGTLVYNRDYHVPQYCNGGQWVAMGPVPGAGGAGCSSPSGPSGAFIYNNDSALMQYCDGTDWIALRGYHSAALNTCDDPDAFDFTDQSGVEAGTLTPSEIVQITGLTCFANVSVSGDGSPEYRVCTDGSSEANCDGSEVTAWGSAPQPVNDGQYLQLRNTSAPTLGGTTRTATVVAGQDSDDWVVSTRGCDSTPATFSFTDASSEPLSQPDTRSDIAQITGIDTIALGCGAAVTLSGDASAEYRICDDGACSADPAWGTSGQTIDNGQYVQARVTTSSANGTGVNATLDIGGIADTFTATTCGDPSAFSFTDLTDRALSTQVTSDIVQIAGTGGCDYNVSLSGDASAEYRICGDGICSADPAWGTAAQVTDAGDYVQLRLTTSGSNGTESTATLAVGATESDIWNVTTVPEEKFVFAATNGGSGYTGNFGGVAGADSTCGTEASGAGLGGTYKAWIADSSGSNDPANNFTGVGGAFRYKLPGGTKIADSWTDLTDGSLDAGIGEDAAGNLIGANSVWANVTTGGGTLSTNTNQGTCVDWSSNATNRKGQEGTAGSATSTWTDNATATACNATYYLYCFEQ